LIDVIGKTGRNWPIRDGKDQIKLIASSVKSAGQPAGTSNGRSAAAAPKREELTLRSRENSTNVTRDPHATLSLFGPRDQNEQDLPPVIAPRASAKPPPRDYHDLFVGNEEDQSPIAAANTAAISRERSSSPSKHSAGIAPKGGNTGRNYQPSRLFDHQEDSPIRPSPDKNHSADHFYRPNPAKYNHFDLASGNDSLDSSKPAASKRAPTEPKTSKHGSQWTFDDFHTPQKSVPTKGLRNQEVRHWGNEEDIPESPIHQKRADKPRKDAETHFEFVDDGIPDGAPRLIGRPRGAGTNTSGLYQNNIYDDDGKPPAAQPESRVLGNIANVKDRRKDFDPQFTYTHDTPVTTPKAPEKLPEGKAKAVKMMDANWAAYDESPSAASQKENKAPKADGPKGIVIAGDGMGSRKGAGALTEKPKGISIGGDGMGGKAGAGRGWGIGDESDGEETVSKAQPGRKQGNAAQTGGGDFWDF
jgi:hypothetical protein